MRQEAQNSDVQERKRHQIRGIKDARNNQVSGFFLLKSMLVFGGLIIEFDVIL